MPIHTFPGDLHREGPTRVIHFDNAKDLKTSSPATSPNCLVSYVLLCAGESLTTDIEPSSHFFYVLQRSQRHITFEEHAAIDWDAFIGLQYRYASSRQATDPSFPQLALFSSGNRLSTKPPTRRPSRSMCRYRTARRMPLTARHDPDTSRRPSSSTPHHSCR